MVGLIIIMPPCSIPENQWYDIGDAGQIANAEGPGSVADKKVPVSITSSPHGVGMDGAALGCGARSTHVFLAPLSVVMRVAAPECAWTR